MRRLALASSNAGKLAELKRMLAGRPIEAVGLEAFDPIPAPEEYGRTFFENAFIKALYYANRLGIPALADDSGLVVDALGGRPGVASARWAGEPCDDRRNNEKLIHDLESSGAGRPWTARYECALVAAQPGVSAFLTTHGTCEGEIRPQPAGEGGFGYDPFFYSPETGRSMAELDPATKNRISHRGKAFAAMVDRLAEWGWENS